MNKELEKQLWDAINPSPIYRHGRKARDVIAEMANTVGILTDEDALDTLYKWAEEGCYDYGVSIDLGWPIPGRTPKNLMEST